jgi:hypothetical protein
MTQAMSRHDWARKLGRRVSRGEFERTFGVLEPHVVMISSNSKGRATGSPRVTKTVRQFSPKWWRKHRDTYVNPKSRRARYDEVKG